MAAEPQTNSATEDTDNDTETPKEESSANPTEYIAALEQRIDQLTQAIQSRGDVDGQLANTVSALQAQIAKLGGTPEERSRPATEPSSKFQEFYGDIDNYIKRVALEASRETLGPHIANQAIQTRDALLAQAKAGVDSEYGEGTWDTHLAAQVEETLKQLPLEMQSSRHHVEAAISAILGRHYFNPQTAKELENRRASNYKKREEAVNMLPAGRPRPERKDTLDESELTFLDSLKRSGFNVDPAAYRAAKTITTIDDYLASNSAASKGSSKK